MKVLCCPADDAGCGWYRMRFPAMALQREGFDVEIDAGKGPKMIWAGPEGENTIEWKGETFAAPPTADHELIGLMERPECDVIVFQRPARRWIADAIPILQHAGIRVVVDVDDLFDAIATKHIARHHYEDIVHNHRWVDEACKRADVVTVTTPALLKRYGYGHGVVIPNFVPAQYLYLRQPKHEHSIGWGGFVGTHPDDLEVTGGAIGRAVAETGWDFCVVGPARGVREALRIGKPIAASGALPFFSYSVMVSKLDLGIVPLAPTPFNAGKSCLKALEYAALGVPCVLSPTPDNARLHALGVGQLADSPSQWRRICRSLMASDERRAELADAGVAAARLLTYEENIDGWVKAWTEAP